MNVLSFDSCADILNIGIETKDSFLSLSQKIEKKFSEELVSRLKWALEEQQLTFKELSLVVCSKGPGSFTGLRVGMAVAKGIAIGADIDLVSVSTTESYAYPLRYSEFPTLILIDAKKRRFYNALFFKGERLSEDRDSTLSEIAASISNYEQVIVSGLYSKGAFEQLCDEVTGSKFTTKLVFNDLYSAGIGQSMIILGKKLLQERGPDPIEEGPTYIRKSDAELSLEIVN